MFAKLYERDGKQVLVKMDQTAEDFLPEVRFYFQPEGLGVCSSAMTYKDDSKESWDKCEEYFNSIDEGKAFAFADEIMKDFKL